MLDRGSKLLETDNLTKRFGGLTAVDSLSISLEEGEIRGIIGPNGSGKTTTIRMLLGLLRPTAGEATVLGLDIVKQVNEVKKCIGYMSQLFTLYNELTAIENVHFYGQAYGLGRRELRRRAAEIMDMAGAEFDDFAEECEAPGEPMPSMRAP